MSDRKIDCKFVYETLEPLLRCLGKVVLAGGCVRDEIMGRKPKDYDVYVLWNSGEWRDSENAFKHIVDALDCLYDTEESEDYANGSVSQTVCNVNFDGARVQVIGSSYQTLEELLDSFDWRICLFGFNERGVYKHSNHQMPAKFAELYLHKCSYPVSTLRRGFRFCDRYQMRIHNADLVQLCQALLSAVICEDQMEKDEEVTVEL